MKRLELPPTLRIPTLAESPKTDDVINSIKKSETANITEGFTFAYNKTHGLPFKFYAEINIDNSRLWELFKTFVLHLPDEASLIFNHADDEAQYTQYIETAGMLAKLYDLKTELTQDCFFEYGVIHQTENFLEEVFVDCTKYLKYWGSDEAWFRATMATFNLVEKPDLNFIDEFPKMREALRLHHKNVMETDALIQHLEKRFPIAKI